MNDAPATRLSVLVPFALVTLIWGSTWIVIRNQLGVVPPGWSVSYRFLTAGAIMAVYARLRGERLALDLRGLAFASAIAVFQFVLNFNFVYRAEHFVTSGLVAVVFALLLVPNAGFARVFLGQRLSGAFVGGSALAIAGVTLLFVHELHTGQTPASDVLIGIALTLGGVVSASAANVMQASETARRYPMVPTLAIAMIVGALLDAALAWVTTGPPVFDWRIGYLAGVLYLAVFASALAFTLYFGVIRAIGPAKAAYSSVIVPVIAMLLSTVFEGYVWSPLAIGGAVLAGVGLMIALRARQPARAG